MLATAAIGGLMISSLAVMAAIIALGAEEKGYAAALFLIAAGGFALPVALVWLVLEKMWKLAGQDAPVTEHDRRAAAEWARHRDFICLGTLAGATAVTGAAVVIAPSSEMARALAAGNLTAPAIIWGGLGIGVLGLYLAITLVAGVTIHVFPGPRGHNPALKRLGVTAVHMLFALEALALAMLLAFNMLASGSGVYGGRFP